MSNYTTLCFLIAFAIFASAPMILWGGMQTFGILFAGVVAGKWLTFAIINFGQEHPEIAKRVAEWRPF